MPLERVIYHPLQSAMTGVFSPSVGGGSAVPAPVLANKVLWLKKGVGITHVANVVSAWADQSGAGNNLVQATESKKPILQGDGTILFDGVDDAMSKAFTLNRPSTVYVRYTHVATVGSNSPVVAGNVQSGGEIYYASGANIPWAYAGAGINSGVTTTLGAYYSVAAMYNGASSIIRVGATEASGDTGGGNMGGVSLAGRPDGLGFQSVRITEVIVYNVAHTLAERNQNIAYLDSLTP